MANLTLRSAKRDDARAIAQIHVAAWRAAYRGLMPDDYLAALSVDARTTMWQNALGRATPAQVALAEIDGTLAGFCSYGPTRDEEPPEVAEIYAVNIHPDYWRRGAGRLLCEHALREAAAREHSAITLWVMTGNERARGFYERLKFAPDGALRTNSELIGRPFDELRYRKAIA
jgi:ribosomal protein S18 acetylase RimI-like enzyme